MVGLKTGISSQVLTVLRELFSFGSWNLGLEAPLYERIFRNRKPAPCLEGVEGHESLRDKQRPLVQCQTLRPQFDIGECVE